MAYFGILSMPTKYKSLQEENPILVTEWNNDKNGQLTPLDVSLMSKKKVWWKCVNSHEWEMIISARTAQKQNCPFCSNKRACKDNCLDTKYPKLSKEWDYIKNVNLTPQNVLPHSHKKIWWLCLNGHSFNAWISDRTNGTSKCTQCQGYTIRDRKIINTESGYRICKYCHIELSLNNFRVKSDKRDDKKRLDNVCKKCSSNKVDEYRKTNKGIAAEIVRRTKYICKKNKLLFDLNKEWVFERLNSIEWKCELTGLPMVKNTNSGFKLDSISVDRIKPGQGYTKDNIRFVLNQVNIFRQNGSDESMYIIAKALLDYKKVLENE